MTEKTPTAVKMELRSQSNGLNKRLGGSQFDEWNNRLSDLIASAMPTSQARFLETATAAAYGTMDIKPADPVEAMIIGQMIVANEAALSMYQRAWAQPAEYFQARTKYLALADKAARTVVLLSELLDQHRCRGQQQIIVKHVTVNAENAMVADKITTTSAVSRAPSFALAPAGAEKPMRTLGNAPEPVRVEGVGVQAK